MHRRYREIVKMSVIKELAKAGFPIKGARKGRVMIENRPVKGQVEFMWEDDPMATAFRINNHHYQTLKDIGHIIDVHFAQGD